MGSLSRSVEIDAPAARVWALLEDVRRLPEFSDSTVEVSDAPEKLSSAGQSYVQVGKLLGKKYRSQWTVTDLTPGVRIRSEGTIARGVAYCLTQTLDATEDGRSRLRIDVTYALPGGALGMIAAKAGIEARAGKEAQQVLDGIKRIAESGVDR